MIFLPVAIGFAIKKIFEAVAALLWDKRMNDLM